MCWHNGLNYWFLDLFANSANGAYVNDRSTGDTYSSHRHLTHLSYTQISVSDPFSVKYILENQIFLVFNQLKVDNSSQTSSASLHVPVLSIWSKCVDLVYFISISEKAQTQLESIYFWFNRCRDSPKWYKDGNGLNNMLQTVWKLICNEFCYK
jgi:hypothetical protein